jgi:hypothetical protein
MPRPRSDVSFGTSTMKGTATSSGPDDTPSAMVASQLEAALDSAAVRAAWQTAAARRLPSETQAVRTADDPEPDVSPRRADNVASPAVVTEHQRSDGRESFPASVEPIEAMKSKTFREQAQAADDRRQREAAFFAESVRASEGWSRSDAAVDRAQAAEARATSERSQVAEPAIRSDGHDTVSSQPVTPDEGSSDDVRQTLKNLTRMGLSDASQRRAESNGQVPVARAEIHAPSVRITIGRIEVRAAPRPAQPAKVPAATHPQVMSLDEYLQQRRRGGSP